MKQQLTRRSRLVLLSALAVLALGFLFIWASISSAANSSPRDAHVSLYVTVEHDGGLVQGLKGDNFRLYQDGETVPFRLAKPEKPAAIALLVEYSQSSWLYLRDIQRAMQGFTNVAPEGHWYALATFAHELKVQVDFTKRRGAVSEGFQGLTQPLWQELDTYDAIYKMLDKMSRMSDRRILIFVGSGFDTLSSHTLEDVEKKIESVNAVVYAIGAGSSLRGYYEPYLGSADRMKVLQAEAFLRMLADKSGGQAWFPQFEMGFPDVMQAIMQMIESQYRLVYEAQRRQDDRFHEVEVVAFGALENAREKFDVRVREGWRF